MKLDTLRQHMRYAHTESNFNDDPERSKETLSVFLVEFAAT